MGTTCEPRWDANQGGWQVQYRRRRDTHDRSLVQGKRKWEAWMRRADTVHLERCLLLLVRFHAGFHCREMGETCNALKWAMRAAIGTISTSRSGSFEIQSR